jgi:hypothetical protein
MLKVAGSAVTPDGKPLTVTLMLAVKLLIPVAETVTVWLSPALRAKVAGAAEMEKSPVCVEPPPPPLLPHPASDNERMPTAAKHNPEP